MKYNHVIEYDEESRKITIWREGKNFEKSLYTELNLPLSMSKVKKEEIMMNFSETIFLDIDFLRDIILSEY